VYYEDTLYDNEYPPNYDKITKVTKLAHQEEKWALFTCCGNETISITKIFTNTNIRIARRTNSTIEDTEQTMSRTQKNTAISGFSNRSAQKVARNRLPNRP
jgi:hypothetical protein